MRASRFTESSTEDSHLPLLVTNQKSGNGDTTLVHRGGTRTRRRLLERTPKFEAVLKRGCTTTKIVDLV